MNSEEERPSTALEWTVALAIFAIGAAVAIAFFFNVNLLQWLVTLVVENTLRWFRPS